MPDTNSKITDGFNNKTGFALGRQLTIEYYECASNVLLDRILVEKALLKAAKNSGATIISSSFHGLNPRE